MQRGYFKTVNVWTQVRDDVAAGVCLDGVVNLERVGKQVAQRLHFIFYDGFGVGIKR